jgi:signal peptidase I
MLAQGFFAFIGGLIPVPGFGHIALGRTRAGYRWLAAVLGCAALTMFSVWMIWCAIAVWLLSAADACVIGYRADPGTLRVARLANLGIFVAAIVSLVALRVFVVEAFKIPASSMSPTLMVGDHIYVDKVRGTSVGDVVVFVYPCDPRRDYIKRVVAKEGDRVEVRCNVVYVNSQAIPSKPFAGSCSYPDYDATDARWFQRTCSRYRETLAGHTYDTFHDAGRPARDQEPVHTGDSRDFPFGEGVPSCENADASAHGQVMGRIEGEPAADPCAPGGRQYIVPPGHVFVLGDNRHNSNDSRVWGSVPVSAIKGRAIGIWYAAPGGEFDSSRLGPIE